MENKEIKTVCYANDVLCLAESEDDVQRNLYTFNITTKHDKMKISSGKTKCLTS